MRLTSVNVGRAVTHDINGQPVHTAYLKQPVAGPVRITHAGPEGNEVAVHTDAVYAFAEENYARFAAELGSDPGDWRPGHFAENLTIAGLDERSLCVGDLLRVGAEVELVVAGPRIPCFKLAWRMLQPESFIQQFATSGRTGVYFAVMREGAVASGDEIEVIERSNLDTVAGIAALISGDRQTTSDHLQALLALPCLSQTVALGLRSRLYRLLDGEQTLEHRWQGWRALRVARVADECAGVRSFHLEAADGAPLPKFCAGQFLTLRCPLPDGDRDRTWSLSDYTSEPQSYRLSIKREDGGTASVWMHDRARVGTELLARAPAGRFVLDRGAFKPVVLVAAGIGITPLIAMARSHLARGPTAPPLYVVHCVRDGRHCPFSAELSDIASHPSVRVYRVYSRPGPGDVCGRDYSVAGRLTLEGLATLLRDTHIIHGGRRIDLPWYDCEVYLCGPTSFQDSLLAQMSARGIDTGRIRCESFLRPRVHESASVVDRAEVWLQRSGRRLEWQADSHSSLLELLEQSGVERASVCRMGICHTCRCALLGGEVEYNLVPQGVEPNAVLLCCSRPASTRVVLDA